MILRVLAAACAWACLATDAAMAQTGRWLRAESENFIVYGDRDPESVRAAARMLEDFDTALRRFAGTEAPPASIKLRVYLVRDIEGLRVVRPGTRRETGGFYRADPEETAAFLIYTDLGGLRRNVILFHEYAHHFMLHYYPHAYPRWYVEGWAEYVSTAEFSGRSVALGIPSGGRGSTLGYFGLLPIEQLLAPEQLEGRRIRAFWAQFYANAWFVTDFVLNRPERRAGLERYVRALGDGGDPIEAFAPAFGITQQQFQQELQAAMQRGRSPRIRVQLPAEEPQVEVRRMHAVADSLLLPLARARSGAVTGDDALALAADLERHAGAYPNEPLAQIALARAARLRADRPAARAIVERILAEDPEHVEARYLLAATILDEAEQPGSDIATLVSEARRHLVQGFRVDPDHAPTLYAYARTFAGGPRPMSEAQLNVLARALELAPQAGGIRLLMARELMRAEEFDAAIVTLRPLLYAPHNNTGARQARAMFEAAQRREQPPESVDTDGEADEEDAEED